MAEAKPRVSSDRVFQAYDSLTEKYPELPQKERLRLAYEWNSIRKDSTTPFDCNEFWGFIETNAKDHVQAEIDFYEYLLEPLEDLVNDTSFDDSTLQYLMNKENKQNRRLAVFRKNIEELKARKKGLDEIASEAEDKTQHQKEIYKIEQEIKKLEKEEETLYYENKETDSNIRSLKKRMAKEKAIVKQRIDEIDVWIEKGHKKEFLSQLSKQDVKLDEIDVITKREDESRYAITFRAFSKYKVPRGDKWQVKSVFKGEGKLESTGKGRGWHGESDRHSKAAKKGKADLLTEDAVKKPTAMQVGKEVKKQKAKAKAEAMQGGKKKKKVTQQVAASKRAFTQDPKIGKAGKAIKSKLQKQGENVLEVGSPEQFIKVGEELLPLPVLSGQGTQVRGRQSMGNRPMMPVTSSNVQGRAVRGNNLYVKFHSSPSKVYKYQMPSAAAAIEAYEEIAMESPGRWVWENVRGKKMGPVFGRPQRKTPGGTSASIQPYDKLNYNRVKKILSETPGFDELSAKLRKYKMEVKKDDPTSAEPFTQQELMAFNAKVKEELAKRKGTAEELSEMFKKKGLKGFNVDMTRIEDSEPKEGRWVTITGKEEGGGRHVFIPKGKKIQFGKGGKFKTVSKGEHEAKKEKRIQKKVKKGKSEPIAKEEGKLKREKRKGKLQYNKLDKKNQKEKILGQIEKSKSPIEVLALQNQLDKLEGKSEAGIDKVGKSIKKKREEGKFKQTSLEETTKREKLKKELKTTKSAKRKKEIEGLLHPKKEVSSKVAKKEPKKPDKPSKKEEKVFTGLSRKKTQKEQREEKIQKKIERTGITREEAEKKIKEKELAKLSPEERKMTEEKEELKRMKHERSKLRESRLQAKEKRLQKKETESTEKRSKGGFKAPKKKAKPTFKELLKKEIKKSVNKKVGQIKPKRDYVDVILEQIDNKNLAFDLIAKSIPKIQGLKLVADSFKTEDCNVPIKPKKVVKPKKEAPKEVEKEEPKEEKQDFTHIENDFMPFTKVEDSTLGGYIVRDGPYLYGNEVKYKEWDNIQEVYGTTSHMPAYGSKKPDSHTEKEDRMFGYFDTFQMVPKGEKGPYEPYIDDKFNRVATKLHTKPDILELTDLDEQDLYNLPVSASYDDLGRGNLQHISRLHHGAVSLNKNEIDRCSTLGGSSCNMSLIKDFIRVSTDIEEKGSDYEIEPINNDLDTLQNQHLTKTVLTPIKN